MSLLKSLDLKRAVETVGASPPAQSEATARRLDNAAAKLKQLIATASGEQRSQLEAKAAFLDGKRAQARGQGGPASGAPQLQQVSEPVVLQSITVSPDGASITADGHVQFQATADYSDGTSDDVTGSVTWASSEPAITIDAKGRASARAVSADAVITATDAASGVNGTAKVSVAAPQQPALVKITVTPLQPKLMGKPAFTAFSNTKPVQQQFRATGHYKDKSTADLTARVAWSSTQPDVIAIDDQGLATVGFQAGKARIVATDRSSAGEGVAIGDSTQVTVTIPVVTALRITPPTATLDAGAQQRYQVSRVYSDGSSVEVGPAKGALTWSSSSDALVIDDTGLAQARHRGNARLSVTDAQTQLQATLDVTVETERSKQTPFGRFSWLVGAQAQVLPLLDKAVQTYTAAEALDEKLEAMFVQMMAASDKIGTVADMERDIDQYTDRMTKLEAATARNAKVLADALKEILRDFEEKAKQAEENLTITKDDVEAAEDTVQAAMLMEVSNKLQEEAHLGFELIKAGVEFENPVAAVTHAVVSIAEYYTKKGDEWAQEARELQEKANAIGATNAAKKFKMAGEVLKALKAKIPKMRSLAESAADADREEWKTLENNYDNNPKNKGKFRIKNLQPGIDEAVKTRDFARRVEQAAYGAREAAKALNRPKESPSSWMADPKTDEEIIKSLFATATGMFDQATAKKDSAIDHLKRFQDMYQAARERIFKAPANDAPKAT